jgi:predicted RNA-binding protein associated with RNAse of E/G family
VSGVRIHYERPGRATQIFEQQLVAREADVVVTLLEGAELPRPVVAGGRAVLEPGAPVVWFTFPGAWHDIGRFHLNDGTFTGYYANMLTPVEGLESAEWRTMDLFLDLWLPDGAEPLMLLDEDELEDARIRGLLKSQLVDRARFEAGRLTALAERGVWPPAACAHWTLELARSVLARKGT